MNKHNPLEDMLIELGNTAAIRAVDGAPKVTTIHIPEADETGKGGYSHKVGGITVDAFRQHRQESIDLRNGITRLPDHEVLLSVVNAWPAHSSEKPSWIEVTANELTPKGVAEDVWKFLDEFYGTNGAIKPIDVEETHWTQHGPPGRFPSPPPIEALFTNAGRVLQAHNYGGGQVGYTAAATASSSTSLTNSGASWSTNAWAGYRVYAQSSTSNMVWANVISNSATVLTVDQWYAAATPGGSAGSTPSSTSPFLIADGGSVSAWFVGLNSTNISPAAGDTSLASEVTTSSGGLIRKIAPFSLTSGTSPMTYTLTPVYTANGSDSLPVTIYAIGVFNSMVHSDTTDNMLFETSLNASATLSASGDQLTVTETVTGS
jgi:hypothetical protein